MDIKHYCIEKGHGEKLILLHGNDENSDYFAGQIDLFSKYFHVYAIDTRGHGRTPRGEEPFTISQFADDLYEFMKHRGISKANLLGFSDGGNIALLFAIRHSDMLIRLIVDGANLNTSGVKLTTQLPIEIGYRINKARAKNDPKAKAKMEMLGLMVDSPNIDPSELSKITVKTLVMAGTRDLIKRKHTELISASIPDSELVFVKGNHYIARNNSEEFNEKVFAFLTGKIG